jgi:hypothetical protein
MDSVINGHVLINLDTEQDSVYGTFALRSVSREGDTAVFTDGKFGGRYSY